MHNASICDIKNVYENANGALSRKIDNYATDLVE